MRKGTYGTAMSLTRSPKPWIAKAKHQTWCRKCRAYINKGELARQTNRWAEHAKKCPSTIETLKALRDKSPPRQ